jgi:oxygen-independent coproporphyrinogen-3 oxidase
MAGIYIHIPFCRKACTYCDFHYSTTWKEKNQLIDLISKEIEIQRHYLNNEPINTIYFGGGTPSILSNIEINKIIDQINGVHSIASDAEITLEANPDDLSVDNLKLLKQTPINRLSVGIQSFYDEDLKWMNRTHNAQEAYNGIQNAQNTGFENITCDLIYGYPLLDDNKWANNIDKLLTLGIPHISSYSMTIEPNTALDKFIKKGKQIPMDENQSIRQFQYLMQRLAKNGFIHYEISNFSKKDFMSRHNTNYWLGEKYLGIGPSAHSFNGDSRQWNVSNNNLYIAELSLGSIPFTMENLTKEQQFNEYIMTSIRTIWGISLPTVKSKFNTTFKNSLLKQAQPFLNKKWISLENNTLKLTNEGKIFADLISSELFY